MLLGDPYKFAVLAKVIPAWNVSETFGNGVLMICIDGQLFPREIVIAPLKAELYWLGEKLRQISVDKVLYQLPKEHAFAAIYDLTFPLDSAAANDYRFDLTPDSLADSSCFVFAVSDGERVRFMAAELAYNFSLSRHDLRQAVIRESTLSIAALKQIAAAMIVD